MWRLFIPFVVGCLGITVLSGCWSASQETVSFISPHQPISRWTTWGLHVGRTSLPEAIAKLGKPTLEERQQDGSSRLTYRWDIIRETGIGTLCGFSALGAPEPYSKTLMLDFGTDGRLKAKRVDDSRDSEHENKTSE